MLPLVYIISLCGLQETCCNITMMAECLFHVSLPSPNQSHSTTATTTTRNSFFMFVPSKESIFFDHLLWSIFSVIITHILQITVLHGHDSQLTPLRSNHIIKCCFHCSCCKYVKHC